MADPFQATDAPSIYVVSQEKLTVNQRGGPARPSNTRSQATFVIEGGGYTNFRLQEDAKVLNCGGSTHFNRIDVRGMREVVNIVIVAEKTISVDEVMDHLRTLEGELGWTFPEPEEVPSLTIPVPAT